MGSAARMGECLWYLLAGQIGGLVGTNLLGVVQLNVVAEQSATLGVSRCLWAR